MNAPHDRLQSKIFMLGLKRIAAAQGPTGLARSIAANQRQKAGPRLTTFAATENNNVPVTLRDLLLALGKDVPPESSGAELWQSVEKELHGQDDLLDVGSLGRMLGVSGDEMTRAGVEQRLRDLAEQAAMPVTAFSAATGLTAKDHTMVRVLTAGVAEYFHSPGTGLARAITANRREHARKKP